MTILSIILLLTFSLFSASLGRLYQYLIQPSQLFGFVSKMLPKIKNLYIYKSIGGCEICTTQRIADFYFILYICLTDLHWWLYIPLYLGHGGFVFWLNIKRSSPIVKSQKLEM